MNCIPFAFSSKEKKQRDAELDTEKMSVKTLM